MDYLLLGTPASLPELTPHNRRKLRRSPGQAGPLHLFISSLGVRHLWEQARRDSPGSESFTLKARAPAGLSSFSSGSGCCESWRVQFLTPGLSGLSPPQLPHPQNCLSSFQGRSVREVSSRKADFPEATRVKDLANRAAVMKSYTRGGLTYQKSVLSWCRGQKPEIKVPQGWFLLEVGVG